LGVTSRRERLRLVVVGNDERKDHNTQQAFASAGGIAPESSPAELVDVEDISS